MWVQRCKGKRMPERPRVSLRLEEWADIPHLGVKVGATCILPVRIAPRLVPIKPEWLARGKTGIWVWNTWTS